MMRPQQYPLAAQSAGCVPLRRAASVRRTTSIDVTWPDGFGGPMRMQAMGRDFATDGAGNGHIVDTAAFDLMLSPDRTVTAAHSADNGRWVPNIDQLVGARAGGASRKLITQLFGDQSGKILFQLLDDFAGASLVAGWAWSNWMDDWEELLRLQGTATATATATATPTPAGAGSNQPILARDMTNICVGFAAGGSSLQPDGSVNQQVQSRAIAGALTRADDPDAWHAMPNHHGTAFRRARWIDLWSEAGAIAFEGGFQDSSTTPAGERMAVHEYRLSGKLAEHGPYLAALDVLPQVLPYRECPGAVPQAARMIDANVEDFRQQVLVELRGISGCTHLNDMLRALSDILYLSEKIIS